MPRLLVVVVALCIGVPAVALAAADTDPKERFTAADQAKARAVVLKRSDFVAGWKKVPAPPESDEPCPGFNPDNSDLTISGEAIGNFEHTQGLPSVLSVVDVYVSEADAAKSWARNVKPALARCFGHFFLKGAQEEGVKARIVSQGRISFPKVAPRTAAFRVVARLTVEPQGQEPVTVPITMHIVALGRGRGEVGLLTSGVGAGVHMADLRAFAKLVASRLAAAKL
jgi:hypothetical protein